MNRVTRKGRKFFATTAAATITIKPILGIILILQILVLTNCGDDNGGNTPSTGSEEKDACIAGMLADKTNTPRGIAANCGVLVNDSLWTLLADNIGFGECKKGDERLDPGSTLAQIEKNCKATIGVSSSDAAQSSSNGVSSSAEENSSSSNVEISSSGETSSSSVEANNYSSSSGEETSSSSTPNGGNNSSSSNASGSKCKGDAYEPSTHFCGGDDYGTLEKCKGETYEPSTHFCGGSVHGILEKCKGETYNPNTQGCCNNEPYAQASHFCGGGNYGILIKCNGDAYNPLTQFCDESGYGILDKCEGGTYSPSTQFCDESGYGVFDKCNGNPYNHLTQFCGGSSYGVLDKCNGSEYEPNIYGCCNNERYSLASHGCYEGSQLIQRCGINPQSYYDPSKYECKPNSNGIYLKEKAGGIYDAVLIGEQIWMAENLNGSVSGSKCGTESGTLVDEDEDSLCGIYGRLYDWATATAITTCPSGWHLPTDSEWDILSVSVGGTSTEAKHLKTTSGWNNDGNGEDTYGFAALPGGYGNPGGSFDDAGNNGYWWSSSEYSAYNAYLRYMNYNFEIANWGNSSKAILFSVRCLQD